MTDYLFNLNEALESEGAVEVRPNLWLMTDNDIPPLLLTAEVAGRCLGIDAHEVSKLIQSGALGSVEIRGARRVPARALRDYVNSLEGAD